MHHKKAGPLLAQIFISVSATFIVFFYLLTCTVWAEILLDPSITGLGAQLMGMGRAGTAASGEIESFILNPATLNKQPTPQFTLMYSRLLNQANHSLTGIIFPSPYGTIGLGYIRTLIKPPPYVIRDSVTGKITLQNSGSSEEFVENILCAAYSIDNLFFKNLNAGLNLKFFYKGFTRTSDYGTGWDGDFGLFYKYNKQIGIGFTQNNILAGLGNKISWQRGRAEALPNASRAGISYYENEYNLALDCEFYPGSKKKPIVMLGGEYWFLPNTAVRLGMDQAESSGANLSFGLAYLFFKYKIDFAYHQFDPLSQGSCAFFSFSYGVFGPGKTGTETGKEGLLLEEKAITALDPPDKSLVFEKEVVIKGQLLPLVKSLEINGEKINLSGESFATKEVLSLGKNSISLTTFDRKGEIIGKQHLRVLRLPAFNDVPDGFWARIPISLIVTLNILEAYPDGSFKPEGNITKKELYAVLSRAGSVSGKFSGPSTQEVVINPDEQIGRAEAITLIAKTLKLPEPKVISSPFPDIPGRYSAISEIISAKEAGLLSFLEGENFAPEQKITRAEICHILSKAPAMSEVIFRLLDFEHGY